MKSKNVGTNLAVGVLAYLMLVSPAFAQVAAVTSVLTSFKSILVGAAVVLCTIAILWAGFKIIFGHAKLTDVANILIGAVLVGGAGSIAQLLIPSAGA